MKIIHFNAAGIDIGAKKVFVAVENQKVVSFFTFTEDFEKLRDYLLKHKIDTVAMEATGVYWVILHDILKEGGIDVWIVDGRQTKQVPGRKTDVKDCQWIQQLHSYGMLSKSYVAEADIKTIRSYTRLREDHIRSASMHINHMQKALTLMNIRLKEVISSTLTHLRKLPKSTRFALDPKGNGLIFRLSPFRVGAKKGEKSILCLICQSRFSQIHGKSGMKIISAILAGERNRDVLVEMCHINIKKEKRDEVYKSLKGKYTEEGLFALKQGYDAYHFYQNQIKECDEKINEVLNKMGNYGKGQPKTKRKPIRHNKPQIKNFGTNMNNIFDSKDATLISGITDYSWLQLLSECGTDLSRWPTEKHYTSWLGLAPGQNNSGSKRKNAKRKGKPSAGQIFRGIAQSIINSKKIALGSFGRRIRARKGPKVANKAVARKLAELYWRVMVKGLEYTEYGIEKYQEQLEQQKIRSFRRLALELNAQVSV